MRRPAPQTITKNSSRLASLIPIHPKMEAADLLSLGFDFYCQSPPRFFDEQDCLAVDDR